jgi:hypothetical protein
MSKFFTTANTKNSVLIKKTKKEAKDESGKSKKSKSDK